MVERSVKARAKSVERVGRNEGSFRDLDSISLEASDENGVEKAVIVGLRWKSRFVPFGGALKGVSIFRNTSS